MNSLVSSQSGLAITQLTFSSLLASIGGVTSTVAVAERLASLGSAYDPQRVAKKFLIKRFLMQASPKK